MILFDNRSITLSSLRSMLCHGQKAPQDSNAHGQNTRKEAQFLRNIRSLKDLSSLSCAFANQCSDNGHCTHGSQRIRRQECQVSTPRCHSNGRCQTRRPIPGKAMQNAIENNGSLLGRLQCTGVRGRRRRQGLRWRRGNFLLPLARFLESHGTNQQ